LKVKSQGRGNMVIRHQIRSLVCCLREAWKESRRELTVRFSTKVWKRCHMSEDVAVGGVRIERIVPFRGMELKF
jgi:hypothetical protein